MNKIKSLVLSFCVFTLVLSAVPAQAKSWMDWISAPKVFFMSKLPRKASDFQKPYLYDAKIPHAHDWVDQEWDPESWIKSRGTSAAVIGDFYASNIIQDQYDEDGVPVLEVGQSFMTLSNQDKLKVVSTIDHVYGITNSSDSMFVINHWKTKSPIGLYTQYGLQLQ